MAIHRLHRMGFFGRRKSKSSEVKSQDNLDVSSSNEDSNHHVPQMPSPPRVSKKIAKSNFEPTLDHVPQFIQDIQTNESGDKAARALRMLFSLSEHPSDNRTMMVDSDLVPTLLMFLQSSERGSSEQYLTLLVLNNISIPAQNKRVSFSACVVQLLSMAILTQTQLFHHRLSQWIILVLLSWRNCCVTILHVICLQSSWSTCHFVTRNCALIWLISYPAWRTPLNFPP